MDFASATVPIVVVVFWINICLLIFFISLVFFIICLRTFFFGIFLLLPTSPFELIIAEGSVLAATDCSSETIFVAMLLFAETVRNTAFLYTKRWIISFVTKLLCVTMTPSFSVLILESIVTTQNESVIFFHAIGAIIGVIATAHICIRVMVISASRSNQFDRILGDHFEVGIAAALQDRSIGVMYQSTKTSILAFFV